MKVAIGATSIAYWTAAAAVADLEARGHFVLTHGARTPEDDVDYPEVVERVARVVLSGDARAGIVLDESTVGLEVTANKIDGIRAVGCRDEKCIEEARLEVDANILCIAIRPAPPFSGNASPLFLIARWVESFG